MTRSASYFSVSSWDCQNLELALDLRDLAYDNMTMKALQRRPLPIKCACRLSCNQQSACLREGAMPLQPPSGSNAHIWWHVTTAKRHMASKHLATASNLYLCNCIHLQVTKALKADKMPNVYLSEHFCCNSLKYYCFYLCLSMMSAGSQFAPKHFTNKLFVAWYAFLVQGAHDTPIFVLLNCK